MNRTAEQCGGTTRRLLNLFQSPLFDVQVVRKGFLKNMSDCKGAYGRAADHEVGKN